ncbi:MAG: hypothetical protein HY513_02990 [Candidatus Aenigmarchaeota archaeon]|nr:hypothetical protein [Candidatus Aenigmarchaeota archaeon]
MPQQNTPTLGNNPTKQFIIEILSSEWPLPARSVYNKLTKTYQLSVTYQAVHKALKEMSLQNIITKNNDGYKLNNNWINQINKFGEKIKKDYENPVKPKVLFEYEFNSLFEAYMSFLPELEKNVAESGNRTVIFHGVHIWNCLLMRSEEEARLKAVAKNTKFYVLANKSSNFDKIMKRYWESYGIKVKIGFHCTSNFDIVVIGDNIYYLHYPQGLLESMETIYSKINGLSDIDIAKLNKDIIYKNCRIFVVVNNNKSVADLIKNWTISQF